MPRQTIIYNTYTYTIENGNIIMDIFSTILQDAYNVHNQFGLNVVDTHIYLTPALWFPNWKMFICKLAYRVVNTDVG